MLDIRGGRVNKVIRALIATSILCGGLIAEDINQEETVKTFACQQDELSTFAGTRYIRAFQTGNDNFAAYSYKGRGVS